MTCKDVAALCPQYLSGELDAQPAAEIAAHLRLCVHCADDLEQQTRLDTLLRARVLSETVNTDSLDRRVRQRIASGRRFLVVRHFALAAGLLAVLFAGFTAYRRFFVPPAPRLCADAARDHFKEVTGHQHRHWLSDPRQVADLAEHNGLPPPLIEKLAPVGYHLEHAKLCRLDGSVFLHLVYVQGTNEFSTYLKPLAAGPPAGAPKVVHQIDSGHEHIAFFQTSQLTAIFVTDQSSDAALTLARSAARVL